MDGGCFPSIETWNRCGSVEWHGPCDDQRRTLIDHEYVAKWTRGYEEYAKSVEDYTPERVAKITGIPAEEIVRAARAYAISPASAILYSMGITQHSTGTDNVQAIANLALISGHLGKSGCGVMPLRGQNNVQGACDMGALAEFYPGYRKADEPETIKFFSSAWSVDSLPMGRGLTATEMIDAASTGEIKAMYIVGEDPANSDPCSHHTREGSGELGVPCGARHLHERHGATGRCRFACSSLG